MLAVVLAVTASACGESIRSEPTGTPSAAAARGEIGGADRRLLDRAERVLERDCLRQHGFDAWPPADPVPGDRQFTYVVDDVAWAAVHGYGSDLARRIEQVRTSDPNAAYFSRLPAARQSSYLDLLHGPRGNDGLVTALPSGGVVRHSDQGCTVEAWRALYGDVPTWFRASKVTDSLAGLRRARVTADPAYVAAQSAWSRCMRQAGYPVADPSQARERAASATLPLLETPEQARDAEIKAAVREATCAQSSGFARTARDLDRRYADLLEREFHTELEIRRRLESAALPRARALLRIDG